MSLAERLKLRREDIGLTQEDLAFKIKELLPSDKFSRVTVSNIELGLQQSVKDRVLLAIVEVLQCSPSWLVLGIGEMYIKDSQNTFSNMYCVQHPLLQENEIPSWLKNKNISNTLHPPYFASSFNCSNDSFIISMKDNLMSPTFEQDDLIYIDPTQKEAIPNNYYLFWIEEKSTFDIKKLEQLDGNFYVVKERKDLPDQLRYQALGSQEIIGKVVYSTRAFNDE